MCLKVTASELELSDEIHLDALKRTMKLEIGRNGIGRSSCGLHLLVISFFLVIIPSLVIRLILIPFFFPANHFF
jgi:hypothetical protein